MTRSTVRVLLALDESPVSIHAAREAARLLSHGTPEFLVIAVGHASAPWLPVGGFGAVAVPPPGWEGSSPPPDEGHVGQRAEQAGVQPVEVLTESGDPVERICAAAEEHDVDLIVVGAHDKGFLARLLAPSVSTGVLRGTDRPVLVVSENRRGE